MNKETLIKEGHFKAVRSSGAGGQHVNKESSKIKLYSDLSNSNALNDEEKELLLKNIATRLTKEGVLLLSNSESRSQHTNKEKVTKQIFEVLEKGLFVPKKRKPTKMSRAQKQKRLANKQKRSQKKSLRKKPDLE